MFSADLVTFVVFTVRFCCAVTVVAVILSRWLLAIAVQQLNSRFLLYAWSSELCVFAGYLYSKCIYLLVTSWRLVQTTRSCVAPTMLDMLLQDHCNARRFTQSSCMAECCLTADLNANQVS